MTYHITTKLSKQQYTYHNEYFHEILLEPGHSKAWALEAVPGSTLSWTTKDDSASITVSFEDDSITAACVNGTCTASIPKTASGVYHYALTTTTGDGKSYSEDPKIIIQKNAATGGAGIGYRVRSWRTPGNLDRAISPINPSANVPR